MTDTTATQGLLRTTASDDPKKMAIYLEGLANGVDRRVTTHLYNQGRARLRPFACVQVNTPYAYDANASDNDIVYDTAAADTAGLVDLSLDASIIRLTKTGWWCFGGYVQTTGFGAANSDTVIGINPGGGYFVGNSTRDQLSGLVSLSASAVARVTSVTANTVRMYISWTGGSTSSVTVLQKASMWAYWVRDL